MNRRRSARLRGPGFGRRRGARSAVGALVAAIAGALPIAGAVALSAGSGACGSRTGLLADEAQIVAAADGGDARIDARPPQPIDDAGEDALPPLDARPPRDASRTDCPDAGATLIYVVTNDDELLSFYPPDGTFRTIGKLVCPDPTHPFSMAVDRKGIAYVLYSSAGGGQPGHIFRVSTATAACTPTTFAPGQAGFDSFGMGFAADDQGTGETLYIASDTGNGALGKIALPSLVLSTIAPFQPPVRMAELTGTGDGRLFAFYSKSSSPGGSGSAVAQIDKASARVVAESALPGVEQGTAWAFAFWGGDFYLFTAPSPSGSRVTRFRPSDGSTSLVATFPGGQITGAGVSTCAPSEQ